MTNNDIYFNETIFTNDPAPATSLDYNIKGFNKVSIIAKITSGQLDIMVSNDGIDFVTYSSLTSDGYVELCGFKIIRMVISSGTVLSAALLAKRRYSIVPMEIPAPRRSYKYKRLDKIGWGKGDI